MEHPIKKERFYGGFCGFLLAIVILTGVEYCAAEQTKKEYAKLPQSPAKIESADKTPTAKEPTANELVNLGLEKESAKDYVAAVDAYKASIKLDERNFIAWINLASIYKIQGSYSLAEEAYKNFIRIFPKDTQGYANLADLYKSGKIGTKSAAIKILEQGIAQTNDDGLKKLLSSLR